jgi:hypothetical protein
MPEEDDEIPAKNPESGPVYFNKSYWGLEDDLI